MAHSSLSRWQVRIKKATGNGIQKRFQWLKLNTERTGHSEQLVVSGFRQSDYSNKFISGNKLRLLTCNQQYSQIIRNDQHFWHTVSKKSPRLDH